jgi:hypothetical protein
MLQIVEWRIKEIIGPYPPVSVFRPPVSLAQWVSPYLIPPRLIVFITPFQPCFDVRDKLASGPALPVIVSTEIVVGILTGNAADSSSIPKKKAVLLQQDGPPRDIYRAA